MEVIWKVQKKSSLEWEYVFSQSIYSSFHILKLQDDYTYNMNIYVITCWPEPATEGRSAWIFLVVRTDDFW